VPDLPTAAELYDAGKAEVVSRDSRLTDWTEGSALDAIVGAGAVQADEVVQVVVDRFAAQFIDTAEGTDLETLAADRFGLTRLPATYAIGPVTLGRTITAAAVTIPAGQVFSGTVDGETIEVELDTAVNMGIGVATATGAVTAAATGRAGNVDVGVIDTVPSPPITVTDLTVTNGSRLAGGDVEETDDEFRARIRLWFPTLRRGTLEALEMGARSVPGVQFATVDESTMPTSGWVSVYIGDPEGTGNATLAALVTTEMVNWRAAGVEVRIYAATREMVAALAITVYIRAGADRTGFETAIKAAIVSYYDNLPVGATEYHAQIESRAVRVSAEQILTADVTAPAADQVPSTGYNALRILAANIAVTFVEVP
jgi:hypothetical protein